MTNIKSRNTKSCNHLLMLFVSLFFVFATAGIATAGSITLGPYNGKVIDSESGEPIAGAAVLFHWLKTVPNHFEGGTTFPFKIFLTYTDSDGNYKVPLSPNNTGLTAVFEETNVIIYKPGYIAYIDGERHFDPYGWDKPSGAYRRVNNLVKLDRIPPFFDHHDHYEDIERALTYLDEYETVYTAVMPGSPPQQTGPIPEKKEFLRLVEWERQRPSLGGLK